MYKPTLVRNCTITTNEDVIGNRLSEDFDLEHIRDDFFCFPIDIWMHEGNIVVACNDVSERGETFFDSLDGYCVGEGVSDVLEFLVGCGGGDEEAMSVAYADIPLFIMSSREKKKRERTYQLLADRLYECRQYSCARSGQRLQVRSQRRSRSWCYPG